MRLTGTTTTTAWLLLGAAHRMAQARASFVEQELSSFSSHSGRHRRVNNNVARVNCTLQADDLECLHGGRCADAHDEWSAFTQAALCDCHAAFEITDQGETVLYAGRNCEIPITEYCPGKDSFEKKNFCVNNGECRVEAENFDDVPCRCREGYVGRHCEYEEQWMAADCPLSCSDHGTCEWGLSPFQNTGANINLDLENQGSYQYAHCVCDDGYAGENCQYEYIKCPYHKLKHYCFHGSVCIQVSGTGDNAVYECECSTVQRKKVAGDYCEFEATDYCEDPLDPEDSAHFEAENAQTDRTEAYCVNNGKCVKATDTGPYFCECDDRHFGKHCENQIQPAPAPTDTPAPTIQLTETMRPTEMASVTDRPTGEQTSSPTTSATSDSTNSEANNDGDDGIPKGAKMGVAFFVIGFVSIIICAACYLRRRSSMVNKATFQETGAAYDINPDPDSNNHAVELPVLT